MYVPGDVLPSISGCGCRRYLVPVSCGKIAEMTIWTSRTNTPVDPTLKHIIWLARKTVIFHSWHDRFEYYYARIWFGRNYFRVKLIPPIQNPPIEKTPIQKKLGGFTGELDSVVVRCGQRRRIKERDSRPRQWVHMSGNTYTGSGTCTYGYTYNMCALSLLVHTGYKNYTIAHESNEHEKFPITMI